MVLSWDADNTDIDLWVVDPSGDKAVYSQSRALWLIGPDSSRSSRVEPTARASSQGLAG